MVNFILTTPRSASTYVLKIVGHYMTQKNLIDNVLSEYIHRASNCVEYYNIDTREADLIQSERLEYGIMWTPVRWKHVLSNRVDVLMKEPNRYLFKAFARDLTQIVNGEKLANTFAHLDCIALERRDMTNHFLSYCIMVVTEKNYHYDNVADDFDLMIHPYVYEAYLSHVRPYLEFKKTMSVQRTVYVEDLTDGIIPSLLSLGFHDAKDFVNNDTEKKFPKRTIYKKDKLEYFQNRDQIEIWIDKINTMFGR